MMSGPTLGNAPQLDNQQLFDAMQVSIADMGDDKRLSGLLMDFSNAQTALRTILGDLNGFADGVKEGKFSQEEIVAKLKEIAEKTFRELGKMRDEDLQRKGTDYQSARWAFLKHFYAMGRNFGVQVELGRLLDKWEKDYPHTLDPKEQTFQEQKEIAFKAVDARFPTMYGVVTKEAGFEADKVLAGSMKYIDEVMIGGQDGPMACYFGEAYSIKHNSESNLSDAEKAKRVEIMKAKLLPMILEALAKDARKATKVIFDSLSKEMYPDEASVRGKTSSGMADEMITHVIRKRCKSNNATYEAYKPLVYYWSNDPNMGSSVLELRQNLIYLIQNQWGPALASDKHAASQADRASRRIAGNQQYFEGYVSPAAVSVAPDVTPPTVRQGKGAMPSAADNGSAPEVTAGVAQQLVATGEGAAVHNIADLRAQLAAKAAQESQQQSGVTIIKPGRVPAPAPSQSVIIDPAIPTENPRDRKTVPEGRLQNPAPAPAPVTERTAKTVPPAASRPQRPDIKIAPRPDMEATQPDLQKKAQARSNGFAKWLKRGLLAAAAALGITAIGVGTYKAVKQADDNRTASTEVGKQNASNAAPSSEATVAAPSTTAGSAPTVALNPTAAAAPSDTSQSGPAAVPQVTNPPKAVETAKVATVLGTHSYGLGSSSGAAPFTGTASLVEGGVDATPFTPNLKTAAWYETQQKSAELLLKIYDSNKSQLDKDTASYVSTHEAVLRDLAAQTDFSPFKFRTGFESKHNSQELYSANGVYNGLLAFERIVDLYGGDTAKLLKDAPTVKLTMGSKLMAPEQRFAKAVLLTASADPAPNPVNQGGTNGNGLPQNAPQDDKKGKTGFNNHVPGFNGGLNAPGVIPQGVRYAMDTAPLQSDNLDVAFNAFNTSEVAKAADRKEVRDYQLSKQVQQHVLGEDKKIHDFEQKRRSRSFFTKLADFGSNIWSGTTPEDREMGLRGTGGIRGLFMSDAQRQAELKQRALALEALERPAVITPKAPVQQQVAYQAPATKPAADMQAAPDFTKLTQDIESSYASDLVREAEAKRKVVADLEKSRLDIEASYKADLAQESAARKAALRADLDAKMEKLFAKGKAMTAERGPLPPISIRKDYTVKKEDRSIKFVLERQIAVSNLSQEAKEQTSAVVKEMIATNGAFIESYKMHGDGSRDLTLKDEWITKLNQAAGVQLVATKTRSAEEGNDVPETAQAA